MKTGLSVTELAAELQRQAESKRDFLAPTERLAFGITYPYSSADENQNKRVTLQGLQGLNDQPMELTNYAHKQVATETLIPGRYYEKMRSEAPELLAENVNHWFQANPKKRLIRTLDGRVRGFLSDKFKTLDNIDLGGTTLEVFAHKGVELASCQITETRLYIKGILPTMTRAITGSSRKGDVVRAGVAVSNSEVGAGALLAEAFFDLLACTNGMIMASTFKRIHVGRAYGEEGVRELLSSETKRQNDKAFWMAVRDVVANAFNEEVFELQVAKMSLATQQKIEGDPVKAIDAVQEIFTLSDTTKSNVLRHLIEGGDLSRWGLANAITRSAEDEEDYESATDLERAGGAVIEIAQPQWSRIAMVA